MCVCEQARQVGGVNTLAAPPSVAPAPIHPVAALRTRWLFSGCHRLPRTPRKHSVLPRLMRLEGFQPAALWASQSPFKMPLHPPSTPPPHNSENQAAELRASSLSVCACAVQHFQSCRKCLQFRLHPHLQTPGGGGDAFRKSCTNS